MRSWWITIHLWLGLSVGILFALLGLTGSVLVFDHDLDAALNPAMFAETGGADEWASFDRMVANANRATAGLEMPLHRLVMPERPGWPLTVAYADRIRRIHVLVTLSPSEARFVIRDEGPGFDPESVPDPTDPANLERESGRGLLLMRTFMDEVRFNQAGNEVTLIKRRQTGATAAA